MSYSGIANDYFEWLCSLVCSSKQQRMSYSKLLKYMHERIFTYSIAKDMSRASDGIDLRYRYGTHHDIPDDVIDYEINCRNCSVFEMLVALALRIEETIMDDPDIGNRTEKWFWMMINNLGYGEMDDAHFDISAAEFIMNRFLDRLYECDGRGGGLVHIRNPRENLRYVEIWYQLMWYLSENYI